MTNLEQRQTMRDMLAEGKKCPEIAKAVGCSVHTVRKWKSRFKKKAAPFRYGAPCPWPHGQL